jgi:hypothetical protein
MLKGHGKIRHTRILFDFESVVDLKLSYIYYLKNNLDRITDDMNKDIIINTSMKEFEQRRMHVYEDPLDYIGIRNKEELDLEHPECPYPTLMKVLIKTYIRMADGAVNPSILCKDESQQRIINEIFNGSVKTLVGSRKRVKSLNFGRIVLANPSHSLEFKDPVTQDFMVLNFRENYTRTDPPELKDDILKVVLDINQFTIANAYEERK